MGRRIARSNRGSSDIEDTDDERNGRGRAWHGTRTPLRGCRRRFLSSSRSMTKRETLARRLLISARALARGLAASRKRIAQIIPALRRRAHSIPDDESQIRRGLKTRREGGECVTNLILRETNGSPLRSRERDETQTFQRPVRKVRFLPRQPSRLSLPFPLPLPPSFFACPQRLPTLLPERHAIG